MCKMYDITVLHRPIIIIIFGFNKGKILCMFVYFGSVCYCYKSVNIDLLFVFFC